MAKIFIDCGYYAGKALEQYDLKGWKIYAFEPNPDIEVPDFVRREAVWVSDGEVTFQIGGRHDAASIEGTGGHGDPKLIKVPSIDFSKFVSELPQVDICSMDIEGAEFKVLEKMLEDKTIDKIKLLDIEFHHRLMIGYEPDDARDLVKRIKARGVKVKFKDKLE